MTLIEVLKYVRQTGFAPLPRDDPDDNFGAAMSLRLVRFRGCRIGYSVTAG